MNRLIGSIEALTMGYRWTNTVAIARCSLAFGTLLTLVTNDTEILFPVCNGIDILNIFCLTGNVELGKWIAVATLLAVIWGIYPRITCLMHWWVSYSFIRSVAVPDGGDHITAILTLLLLPYCLADSRKSHWDYFETRDNQVGDHARAAIAIVSLGLIRIQVAIIYLNAAAAKVSITEWANGTAVYYWFSHPVFGAPDFLSPLITPGIQNSIVVTVITWAAVMLEFVLFAALFMKNRYRRPLLVTGIAFHFGILLIHGLVSFFFAMLGSLLLLLANTQMQIQLSRQGKAQVTN